LQYFDYKVWIGCPIEIATARGKARDRLSGSDEAHIARWDTEWVPKDLKYFNLIHPDKLADFIYIN
jgi:myo-inositol catabolism protein IolC